MRACHLTIKNIKKNSRKEYEININKETFDNLWPLTKDRRLIKTRKTAIKNGVKFLIDEYKGKLEGLYIAEIEFPTLEEAKNFKKPKWLGKEVTYEDEFKNRNLINKTFLLLKEGLWFWYLNHILLH